MALALDQPWLVGVRAIFSSAERKATDAAALIAGRLRLDYRIIAELGENDRSATGYLPKAEFEAVADEFFAHPTRSVRGWERAIDAQTRIIAAVDRALSSAAGDGDIAIVSHGGVGALLLCHLSQRPITRALDQPGGGGGNRFAFDRTSRSLISSWCAIDV